MRKATEFSKEGARAASKKVTEADRAFFARIENRQPASLAEVSRRCRFGFPQVVATFPRLKSDYFPTVYWLLCPYLRRGCGRLEGAGVHRRLEEEVQADESLRRQLEKAVEIFRERRAALARQARLVLPPEVAETGIAGVRQPLRIKCLHAHVAAYLAGIPTPAGEKAVALIGGPECKEGECAPRRR